MRTTSRDRMRANKAAQKKAKQINKNYKYHKH